MQRYEGRRVTVFTKFQRVRSAKRRYRFFRDRSLRTMISEKREEKWPGSTISNLMNSRQASQDGILSQPTSQTPDAAIKFKSNPSLPVARNIRHKSVGNPSKIKSLSLEQYLQGFLEGSRRIRRWKRDSPLDQMKWKGTETRFDQRILRRRCFRGLRGYGESCPPWPPDRRRESRNHTLLGGRQPL